MSVAQGVKKTLFKTLLQIELHHDSKWNKPAEEQKQQFTKLYFT